MHIQSQYSKNARHWLERRRFSGATLKCAGGILVVLNVLLHSNAAPANGRSPVDEVASAKSVFIDNPQFGKDPFFPKTARRAVTVDLASTHTVEPLMQVAGLLLKGISGGAGKRLAIINNRTFEVGEEGSLRVANQIFKIRCVEIRDKSVIVSVNGQTKELFMGQRL